MFVSAFCYFFVSIGRTYFGCLTMLMFLACTLTILGCLLHDLSDLRCGAVSSRVLRVSGLMCRSCGSGPTVCLIFNKIRFFIWPLRVCFVWHPTFPTFPPHTSLYPHIPFLHIHIPHPHIPYLISNNLGWRDPQRD